MTEKMPWMPFYGEDFYESENVRLMSLEEQAKRLDLIMAGV